MELNQCLLFLVTNSILEFRNSPAPFPLSPLLCLNISHQSISTGRHQCYGCQIELAVESQSYWLGFLGLKMYSNSGIVIWLANKYSLVMGPLYGKNDAALQTNLCLLPMKQISNNTIHAGVYGCVLSEHRHFWIFINGGFVVFNGTKKKHWKSKKC